MTSGKAKKSGAPRKAPKVKAPNPKKPNFMREYDAMKGKKSPMSSKRLSK
jgi:hypothetical protein